MAAAEDAFYQLCGEMPGGVPAPSSTPALRTQLHAPLTTNASAAMGANTSVGSYSPACASGHVFSVTVPHEAVGQDAVLSVTCPSGAQIQVRVPREAMGGQKLSCVDPGLAVAAPASPERLPRSHYVPIEEQSVEMAVSTTEDEASVEMAAMSEWQMFARLQAGGVGVRDPGTLEQQEQRERTLSEQRPFSSVDLFKMDSIDAGNTGMSMAHMAQMAQGPSDGHGLTVGMDLTTGPADLVYPT
mmetsp:Transcript_33336/g.88203  ORF Transcript_33336/g.88203 Transcript_33336/m.88203 type:complete len:243 (-) Transcript_33336:644-1372(-)